MENEQGIGPKTRSGGRTLSATALFFLLVTGYGFSVAQSDTMALKPEKSIPFSAVNFTTDNLGNIYFITRDNQLVKYDIHNDTTITYNDFRYGTLGTVDATNPLQVLLFYPDFGTILIMDRFLSLQNTIDLRSLNIFKPDAVASSNDNNIWVYDEQEAELKKIDVNGNPILESVDLRQVLGLAPDPDIILDRDGLVYMNDPAQGIFVFDYYGSYRNTLHFTGTSSLQLFNGQMVLYRNRQMTIYNLRTFTERRLPLPDTAGILMANLQRDKLYVLRKDRLDIFSLK